MSPWSPHSSLGRPHHFFHKSFPGSKGFAHILNGKGPRGPGADSLEEVDGSPEGGAGGGENCLSLTNCKVFCSALNTPRLYSFVGGNTGITRVLCWITLRLSSIGSRSMLTPLAKNIVSQLSKCSNWMLNAA